MIDRLSLSSRPFGKSFFPMPKHSPVKWRCSSALRRRMPGIMSSSPHILRSLIFVSISPRNSSQDACTGVGCFFFFPESFFFSTFFGFSFFCQITVFSLSSTAVCEPMNFRSDTSTRVALRSSLSCFSCSNRARSASSRRAASSARFTSAKRCASAALASASNRFFFSFGVSMCFTSTRSGLGPLISGCDAPLSDPPISIHPTAAAATSRTAAT
mmetsp:Transcript_26610/g.47353  ORF Transcript_26610/g.47353 Transcript_26610/m.47353 type:complete len:214 (-) Transcript_26610:289-930(-)